MITLHTLAAQLNVSYATARRLVINGEIAGYRVGRVIRVRPADVESYLVRQAVTEDRPVQLLHVPKLKHF